MLRGRGSHGSGKKKLKTLCDNPNLDGVDFDYIGYANYHGCYCANCLLLYQEYLKAEKQVDSLEIRNAFYLRQLVDYNNSCVDYVKKLRPDMQVITHIFPVFLPMPLYGSLLKTDYCGQNAAWYVPWPEEKIFRYTKVICEEESRYFPHAREVPFVGYYRTPAMLNFPAKSAQRLDLELRTILAAGARMIMVCDMGDVLNTPEIGRVFAKYCEHSRENKIGKKSLH